MLLASCALAGASPSPNPPTSRPASPTAVPPAPTASAQPIPTATAAPTATDYEQPAPPLGELTLPDGSAIPGYQGTWCYDGACADVIPPDKADLPQIDTSADADLSFTLAATHPFAYWTVDYALEQDDDSTIRLDEGGTYVDPDVSPAASPPALTTFTFEGPPAGDWVIQVRLQFAGGLGDTRYYWHAAAD